MFALRSLPRVLLAAVMVANVGCHRKNNPLLNDPPAGVTSASLFIPQIDTRQSSEDINRVFVYVTDGVGSPLTSFRIGNFSILEAGAPGVPFEVGTVNDGLYIAIVIDRSGSMAGAKTTATNAAAVNLVNAMSGTDQAALIEFSDSPSTTVGFTTNKTTLTNAINAGVASGSTSLYDSVKAGADLLRSQSGRRLLLVLTDGADTASTSTVEEAIDSVNSEGLSCYTVGLGTSGIDFEGDILQRIASDTGGTFNSSVDGSTLSAIFLGILQRFNNLVYIKYRRRNEGKISVFLNYGSITASAEKSLD